MWISNEKHFFSAKDEPKPTQSYSADKKAIAEAKPSQSKANCEKN